jgi:hypothetical protein
METAIIDPLRRLVHGADRRHPGRRVGVLAWRLLVLKGFKPCAITAELTALAA